MRMLPRLQYIALHKWALDSAMTELQQLVQEMKDLGMQPGEIGQELLGQSQGELFTKYPKMFKEVKLIIERNGLDTYLTNGFDAFDDDDKMMLDLANDLDEDVEDLIMEARGPGEGIEEFKVGGQVYQIGTEDAAYKYAVARLEDNMNTDPETYLGEWAFNYMDDERCEYFFREYFNESYSSYASDIMTEKDDEGATSRLASEMLAKGIITEKEARNKKFDIEGKIDAFVELMTEEALDQGRNGYDQFESDFGENEAKRIVMDNNLIDIHAAAEGLVDSDDIGNSVNSYDGSTESTEHGFIYWRTE